MKEPNWIDVDKDKMKGKEYFEELEKEFPKLKEELNLYESDVIHSKMEVFSRYTNEQIELGEDNELVRCFRFQEKRIERMNFDLENALNVSYCETLLTENAKQTMRAKKELMPQKLRVFYNEYEKYYTELFESKTDEK